MTFTAVGTGAGGTNSGVVLSNQAIGNLMMVEVINFSNSTVWASGLTGGGATWATAGVKLSGSTNAFSAAVFMGTVTATGAQTVNPTWSGTAPGSFGIVGHEFHSTVGSWSFDKQGNLDSTGTANWPSLTAAFGAGELYFGYAADLTTAVAGSTSGYTYNATIDGAGNGMAYNVSAPGTATFPVWGDAHQGLGIAVLITESTASPARPVPYLSQSSGMF